ncbi:MAG: HAD-IIB family hydrolase [Anaerostipes sp.]|nr:HAD-IIB family hydrolase [Anaerostipes sp.]MDD3747444.1 HAD-IIB family hydrolase [Anaerostipes sp.]
MKDYKGIVFFDYDGTLIDEVDQIFEMPDSTKEALLRLQENKYVTCICSGRNKLFCEDVKDYMNGYITTAGAYIELDEQIVHSVEIPISEIEKMRAICATRGIVMIMDGETQTYCDGMDTDIYPFFKYVFDVREHWVLPWDTKDKCKINKVTFIYKNPGDHEFVTEHFSSQLEIAKHIRYEFSDATPKGTDKGTGIRIMADYLNLPIDATYAFGDGDNDVSMVKTAGTSIIMGRHYEGLEPYASMITGLVKDDGIYNACKKLNLI